MISGKNYDLNQIAVNFSSSFLKIAYQLSSEYLIWNNSRLLGVSFLSLVVNKKIKKIKNWPKESFTHLANAANFHMHWTHMSLRHWSHEIGMEILSPPKGNDHFLTGSWTNHVFFAQMKYVNTQCSHVGYNEVDVDFYFMSTCISNWSCYDLE